MADTKVTYQLAAEYDAKTFGGNFALNDGSLYDVAAELKKGNGSITTDDEHLITALDVYHGVDRASAPATPKSKDEN
jgi:hypothetical protein